MDTDEGIATYSGVPGIYIHIPGIFYEVCDCCCVCMRIICILLIRLIRQEPARLRIILRVFLEIRTLFFRTEGVQQTVKTAVYSRVKALHVGFSIC